MSLNRGNIILVLFPNSDLITAKIRPALIIQANNIKTGLNQIIIAMITSQMSRANHPSRVTILLDSIMGKNSGLLTNSVVMTDNVSFFDFMQCYLINILDYLWSK